MKDNNGVLNIFISIMIGIITIMATYLIVDIKTSNVADNVVSKMLFLEYDKVGGKENYEKVVSLSREQTIAGLKQLDKQGGIVDNVNNQVNNAGTNSVGTTISLEKAKKITGENTYVLGNPDAEISWVEYSDLECPFCKKLHTSGTIKEVMDFYDGKVNFIFKQFPLSFHQNAQKEHEGALCAGELGGSEKYYSYINTIFERTTGNGRGFSLDSIVPLAVELGLDEGKFKECLDSGKYISRIQSETDEGTSFGITGTPGNVLINNKTGEWDTLPGAYPTASFKQKIDSLLQ